MFSSDDVEEVAGPGPENPTMTMITYREDATILDRVGQEGYFVISTPAGPVVGAAKVERLDGVVKVRVTFPAEAVREWHQNVFGDRYARHRRRCRPCNPPGNPKPLPINGHEYARRRRNRRRNRR